MDELDIAVCKVSLEGANLRPLAHFLSFYHIFEHVHAMVLIYIPKCSPFNLLSNGMFYLHIHTFVYELPVEMHFIVGLIVLGAILVQHKVLIK